MPTEMNDVLISSSERAADERKLSHPGDALRH